MLTPLFYGAINSLLTGFFHTDGVSHQVFHSIIFLDKQLTFYCVTLAQGKWKA